MKYYLDTEFLEGTQKKLFGKSKPTIDLISIGLVAEDGREYYAISKDFNLKEAWNRYEMKQVSGDMRNHFPEGKKEYWIRYNVLVPLFKDLVNLEIEYHRIASRRMTTWSGSADEYIFSYSKLKKLLQKHGKTNKEIASEVFNFVNPDLGFHVSAYNNSELKEGGRLDQFFKDHNVTHFDEIFYAQPEFYTYYGAYDWVVLCWLFGRMIDLPKGFPMYSNDLKQMLDNYVIRYKDEIDRNGGKSLPFDYALDFIKNGNDYPKQSNEHNALADAKWNLELHKFLGTF